jgi:hypothetical protein
MSSSSSSDEEQEIEQQRQTKTRTTATTTNPNDNAIILEPLLNIAKDKGFEIEQNKDYGAGYIDLVWNIDIHPALPKIKCGFVVLRAEEGGSKDWEDNQFSLRKIEEAIIRGARSGMDKTYLVAQNEDMAKSVSGKVEWLASFGSLIRLDSFSLGLYPTQQEPAVIKPSQKRVPKGEKLRKEKIRQREKKLDKYNRPRGGKNRKSKKLRKRK